MNRITVVDENVESNISSKLSFQVVPSHNEFEIARLEIQIKKSCSLELFFTSSSKRWKIVIEVAEGVDSKIYCYQNLLNGKVQYRFQIPQKSTVEFYKFQGIASSKEMVEAHLLGEGATFHSFLKDISKEKETLDYYIYHDAPKTVSNIRNNIVTVEEGKVTLQVSTFIPKGMVGSIASQNNRILNFSDKKSEIRPNLYVEEYDVSANHSALIGRFSEEELFYLMSRGISEKEASRLLLKGFLLSDITNKKMRKKIELSTKKEWR